MNDADETTDRSNAGAGIRDPEYGLRQLVDRDGFLFAAGLFGASAALLASDLPFGLGLAVLTGGAMLLWIVSLTTGNAGIVDVFWGPGFVLVGATYIGTSPADPGFRAKLVFALTTLWAVRLAFHIGRRSFGAGEDHRYRAWRDQAGPAFWWVSLFKVFLLQAAVLWIVSSPLLFAHGGDRASLGLLDLSGLVLFTAGLAIEAIADRQLARFKRNPANRGMVLRTGLWARSRHPNYFGEAVLWWGLGLISYPASGWLTLIGPAFMTFVLVRISGVALLDATLPDRKPDYAEYIDSTPAFIPRLRSRPSGHNIRSDAR